jgi:hypothetical protein
MAQTQQPQPDLVARIRRDLSQLQLLHDMDQLGPDELRRLLASLGELVNHVEYLATTMREAALGGQVPPQPPAKIDAFRALKERFQTGPDRMRTVGGFGVIDGGLS